MYNMRRIVLDWRWNQRDPSHKNFVSFKFHILDSNSNEVFSFYHFIIILNILVLTIRVVTGGSNQPLKLDKRDVFCHTATIENHTEHCTLHTAHCTMWCTATTPRWNTGHNVQQLLQTKAKILQTCLCRHTFYSAQFLHFCITLCHSTHAVWKAWEPRGGLLGEQMISILLLQCTTVWTFR